MSENSETDSTEITFPVDPERIQHIQPYRKNVIREIVSRSLEIAEERDFETSYEEIISEHPEFVEGLSVHIRRKVESAVERKITNERIERGLIDGSGG